MGCCFGMYLVGQQEKGTAASSASSPKSSSSSNSKKKTKKPMTKSRNADVAAANLKAMEKNKKRGKDRMGHDTGEHPTPGDHVAQYAKDIRVRPGPML